MKSGIDWRSYGNKHIIALLLLSLIQYARSLGFWLDLQAQKDKSAWCKIRVWTCVPKDKNHHAKVRFSFIIGE